MPEPDADESERSPDGHAPDAEPDSGPGIKGKGRSEAMVSRETSWCFERKIAGWTFRQIAAESEAELGYPLGTTTVWERIRSAIAERVNPLVDELRAIEEDRLDSYLKALQTKIDGGDDKAIQAALRVSARRAALLGLDAPVKIGMDTTVRYVIEGVDPGALR